VAANATKAVFDTSFDQTAELHDPYLDPDMPSPFNSDWSPDLLPQSTVGGFTTGFTNDKGLETDSPDLTAATVAACTESPMPACTMTTFATLVKFTHFANYTTPAPKLPLIKASMAWTHRRG
jgi:hypothetical protein